MDTLKQIIAAYKEYGAPVLTNFQIEDLVDSIAYEAGVFTLAEIEGNVVLIRRKAMADYPGIETYWWLPGGERETGEGLDEAAIREFREETGFEVHVDRLLAALIQNEQFLMFWFRGQVVAGRISASGDPCNTTAEVRVFRPSEIPVESLWSEVDKVVLARERFIDYPAQDFLAEYGGDSQRRSAP